MELFVLAIMGVCLLNVWNVSVHFDSKLMDTLQVPCRFYITLKHTKEQKKNWKSLDLKQLLNSSVIIYPVLPFEKDASQILHH